jgi:NAD(P)-dependent dehydrogenase (short-subunit alcohol dehydrogenase family)
MKRDLEGKVYVVTGANTGIGRVAAEELARRGGEVVLAGRSEERTAPVVEAIRRSTPAARASFLLLDLADLDSVRAAARAFLARGLPLHGLVNNAGMAGVRAVSREGIEITFATNHLGPFLFTNLLVERMKESAPARIVNVSSRAHYRARAIDWDALRAPARSTAGLDEYSVSKLANVLHAKSLARRLAGTGVTTYALHPGVVATDIWRELPWGLRHLAKAFMISPEKGARTTLHCVASPQVAGETGLYYDDCKPRRPSRAADDAALAEELWRRSEEFTALPAK